MASNIKINELQHLNVVDDVDTNNLTGATGGGPVVGVALGVIFDAVITPTSLDSVSGLLLAGGGSINGSVLPGASFGAIIVA